MTAVIFTTLIPLALAAPHTAHAQIIDLGSFGAPGVPPGIGPTGPVVFDTAGNMYGTTFEDGAQGAGTVWEIAKNGSSYGTLTTLSTFTGSTPEENGGEPECSIVFDASGNMFGTATSGGTSGGSPGVIWEMAANPGGGYGTLTDLVNFSNNNGSETGIGPSGNLVYDGAGNLYGTTSEGSTTGYGTVWELAKGASAISTIATFSGANGSDSLSGVTFDSAGDLFGTSTEGGAHNEGTVWEIAKGTGTIVDLATFTGSGVGSNGALPFASPVTMDAAGNLYGTTVFGGPTSDGTLWEIPKIAGGYGALETLISFTTATGTGPDGVVIDSAGDLFGSAQAGGTNSYGTVWELAAGSSGLSVLGNFTSDSGGNGGTPGAQLTLDGAGNLYGTTEFGGTLGYGTVWEIQGVASTSGVGAASAPEPSAIVLAASGFIGATAWRRRRRSARSGAC